MADREETTGKPDQPEKRALGADLIIPVAAAAFAVYYLSTIWGLPWEATAAGFGITAAMAILLVVLGVRFTLEWLSGTAAMRMGGLVYPLDSLGRRVGLLLLALGFIYMMRFLGFTISLFIFLVIAISFLSNLTQVKKGILIAACVSLGGYLLFIQFIGARFPHGPFERFVGSLL